MGYLSDYANNVSNILQQSGNAQAQARMIGGQAWGNALGNIGQQISALPAQMQQQQASAQEAKLRQMQINTANQAQTDQQALDNAWKLGAKPDGSLDIDALLANVPGHLQQQTRKVLTDYDKSRAEADKIRGEIQKLADEHRTAQTDALGMLALGVKKHGYDPAALTFAVSRAMKDGLIDEPTAQSVIQNLTPDKLKPAIDELIGHSKQASEAAARLQELEKPISVGGSLMTPGGQVIATAPTTPVEQSLMDQRSATNKNEQDRIRLEQQRIGLESERVRMEKDKAEREARAASAEIDPSSDLRTTVSGKKYLDLGDYETPTARQKARDQAKAQGVTVVDKTVGDALRAADTAKLNLQAMMQQIESKLPKDGSGRIVAGPGNKLSQFFQTDQQLAAFNSWRAGAIQAVQALVERGMGFRLNQAEIKLIMENDMPQVTDTLATARQRVSNVMKLIEDKENVALTKDRSALANGAMPGAIKVPAPPPTGWIIK